MPSSQPERSCIVRSGGDLYPSRPAPTAVIPTGAQRSGGTCIPLGNHTPFPFREPPRNFLFPHPLSTVHPQLMPAVYIMASRSRTLYIGVTRDLHHRVFQHKNGTYGGFTSKYRITRLIYFEEFVLMNNAIAREKQLKRWSRSKKLRLIDVQNPTWIDLAEDWYHPESVPPKRNAGPSTPPRPR